MCIAFCYQVVRLDLQHNELSHIPHCLLKLPSLGELNLGHNSLEEIPDILEWSPCLTVLDLSHNQLSSLPINVIAPAIRALNLSHNQFQQVPLCICSFTTLHSLNLSENQDIRQLPAEMGRLSQLSRLSLTGLKNFIGTEKHVVGGVVKSVEAVQALIQQQQETAATAIQDGEDMHALILYYKCIHMVTVFNSCMVMTRLNLIGIYIFCFMSILGKRDC